MWSRARTETFFKSVADDAEDAFKEVGDSLHGAFSGVGDSFARLKMRQPGLWATPRSGQQTTPSSWFSSGSGSPSAGLANAFGRQVSPGAATASAAFGQEAASASRQPPPGHAQPCAAAEAPLPAAAAPRPQPAWPAQDDDDAMRRHCASLERLVVDLGISPQAARVALRHLDAWLVSEAGTMEMAAAEAAGHGSGEHILHTGDAVRLEGMVKNKSLNGTRGTLQCYAADSQRWKVILPGGEVYWVKPKLVKPVEPRRLPLPEVGAAGSPGAAEEAFAKRHAEQATALAAGWALLEARQERLKVALETREIALLEREEAVRKAQEALEEEQQLLGEARHHHAVEQARGLAEIGRHLASAKGRGGALEPVAFSMDDGAEGDSSADEREELELVSTAEGSVRTMGEDEVDEDVEADEVWDMDWSRLGAEGSPRPTGAAC